MDNPSTDSEDDEMQTDSSNQFSVCELMIACGIANNGDAPIDTTINNIGDQTENEVFLNTDSQSTIASMENDPDVPNSDPSDIPETESSDLHTGIFSNPNLLNDNVFHGDRDLVKKRNRKPKASNWKENINKDFRMKGESYTSQSKVGANRTTILRASRKMGPPCASNYCTKSGKRNCSLFSETVRKNIFSNFWKNLDWNQKKSYVNSLVDRTPKKTDMGSGSHFRADTFVYRLWLDNAKTQVCRSMFMSTHGLKKASVLGWLNKSLKCDSNFKKTRKVQSADSEQMSFLVSFLESLPKLPSHYCRADTQKLYLEPLVKSKAHLYTLYQAKCIEFNTKCLSICTLYKQFEKLNLSLFRPKKDECNTCLSFKHNNISKKVYDEHIQRKETARKAKTEDKNCAKDGKCHTLTMDLQSVLLTPKTNANALYYRSKLIVHNFTIYDLTSHRVKNFIWDETEGDLVASTFATCLTTFLESYIDDLPIIIYSDGCGYQNRNAMMSTALLNYVMRTKKIVFQKFLEPGHTQMEADSAHSAIERKLKKIDIFVPTKYAEVSESARVNPFPYETAYLNHSFFKDYSIPEQQRYKSIRPGKQKGDCTVCDLKALMYDPSGIIKYKLDLSEDWSDLPRKPSSVIVNEFSQLYASRLSITSKKWNDLQQLKAVMPSEYHAFYDEIPYN